MAATASSPSEEVSNFGQNIAFHHWPELASSFTLQTMFEAEGQFPLEITQLSPIEFLSLPLSGGVSQPLTTINTTTATNNEEELKDRIRRPFRYIESSPLSLLLMTSPFVNIHLQKSIIEIIMKFQHDILFKNGFSQLITTLYPSLKSLYCRHYGLAAETIFRTTVQVYTANSIVELMSTVGIPKRPVGEIGLPSPSFSLTSGGLGAGGGVAGESGSKHLLITNMLMSLLYVTLKDVGCPNNPEFLNHHSIRTHRLSMICRDLEYVTSDPYYCIQLLRGQMNPGTMELWIDVCSLVQYIDRMRRQTTIHVEHEDEKWQYAANLLLEVESVSEHFIANAFLESSASSESMKSTSINSSSRQLLSTLSPDALEAVRSEALYLAADKTMKGIQQWYAVKNVDNSSSTEQKMFWKFPTNERPHEMITNAYLVSSGPFSVHIPLHRLLMKMFHFACQGGVSCSMILKHLQTRYTEKECLLLMDYPLRCLVFLSQVNHGLWKRNGSAPANLAYNYHRIPLNRTLHDMDILALQITALLIPIKSFYLFFFQRYELLEWIMQPSIGISKESIYILSDLLRVLLQVILYLPVIIFPSSSSSSTSKIGEDCEGVKLALKREVFHQILLGNTSISSLGKLKKLIGTYGTVSDQLLREVLLELTSTRRITGGSSAAATINKDDDFEGSSGGGGGGSGGDQAGSVQLKEDSYRYYDPEFPSLASKQVVQAMDVMKEHFKQQKGNQNQRQEKIHWNSSRFHGNPYLPLLYETAIPIGHPDFLPLRQRLLFSSSFLEMSYRIIQHLCLDNKAERNFNRTTLLGRIIEFFTIQCYLLPPPATNQGNTVVEEYLSHFTTHRVGFLIIQQFLQIYQQEMLKEEAIYHEGLAFILFESQHWSPQIKEVLLQAQFISAEDMGDNALSQQQAKKEDDKDRLRKAAQERLLAQTKARADNAMKAFADMMSSDSSDDEDDDDEDEMEQSDDEEGEGKASKTKRGSRKIAAVPQEVCIICKQKREDSTLGYLCFIQPSTALQHITTQYYCHKSEEAPFSAIHSLYRVVALDGCEVHTLPSESSPPVTVIPYNTHVTVGARHGAWFEILSPVRGFGMIYKETPPQADQPIQLASSASVRNGLSVMNRPYSLNYTTILAPIKSLLYEKNGGTRLHISTCTHAMHFDCWDQFYTAAYARYINHERGAEYQGYDVSKGECLCPLCKNILNSIVPILPDITVKDTVGMTKKDKKRAKEQKEDEQSNRGHKMDIARTSLASSSTASHSNHQRSVSDYVTSFFRSLNIANLSANVSSWNTSDGLNNEGAVNKASTQRAVITTEERSKILRFLDCVNTTSSNMVSFPPTINTLSPFRNTIRAFSLTGSSTQLSYESFLNKFLFGDWKILQSSMLAISSFAYSLSFSSYHNLACFILQAASSEGGVSTDGWALANAEQKLLPQLTAVLQRVPGLFHVYPTNSGEDEVVENPIYTVCFQASLLNLFFCASGQQKLSPSVTTSLAPELLNALSLFPSFPLIYNLSHSYPDLKTFYDILLQLCHHVAAAKGGDSSETGVPYEVIRVLSQYYEVFASPLLSQDLTVVMVSLIPILYQQIGGGEAGAGIAEEGETESQRRWKCLKEFSHMLLLAKINQILIEPKITQIFSQTKQSSSNSADKARTTPTEDTILHDEGLRQMYSQLTSLQHDVYSILQLPLALASSSKMLGNVLLKEVFQGIIPFLEVLLRFHQLLGISVYEEEGADAEDGADEVLYEDMKAARSVLLVDQKAPLEEKNLHYSRYIAYLLQELGLSNLSSILSKAEYVELMKMWNRSYHNYHLRGNRSSEAEGASETVRINQRNGVDWLPSSESKGQGDDFPSIDPISALKPLPPSSSAGGGSEMREESEEERGEQGGLLQLLQQSTASYINSSSLPGETLMEGEDEDEDDGGDLGGGDDITALMNQLMAGNPNMAPGGLEEIILQLIQRDQRLRGQRTGGRRVPDEDEDDEDEDDVDPPATGDEDEDEEEDEENQARGRTARGNNNAAGTRAPPTAAPAAPAAPAGGGGGGFFANLLNRMRTGGNPAAPPAPAANNNNNNNNNQAPATGGRLPQLPITRARANSRSSVNSSSSTQTRQSNTKKVASNPWPFYGILPTHAFFDELAVKNYPHQTFFEQLLRSPIVRNPLESSLTGHYPILTFNVSGSDEGSTTAAVIDRVPLQYPDLSHFNVNLDCLQHLYQRYTFIDLPALYIDLYHMAKFPEGSDGVTLENPAICLLCGQILCAGRKKNSKTNPDADNSGECTLHAMTCGAGIGAFFIIQGCNVLLMRGGRSSYHSTIYLDEHNESNSDTNFGYGHNKPMFLSTKRYQKVKELYLQHVIAKEITRKRVHADNVIRQYWY